MRKLIEYHWVEETLDLDRNIESVERISEPTHPDEDMDICLKQDVWDGEGSDFGYAYIDPKTKKLPEYFDNGRKVPQKFHKQVNSL
tara:strand:- start:371 stop:628 length:258 start_codon:yes stop_codon:yes gene_type:complete